MMIGAMLENMWGGPPGAFFVALFFFFLAQADPATTIETPRSLHKSEMSAG